MTIKFSIRILFTITLLVASGEHGTLGFAPRTFGQNRKLHPVVPLEMVKEKQTNTRSSSKSLADLVHDTQDWIANMGQTNHKEEKKQDWVAQEFNKKDQNEEVQATAAPEMEKEEAVLVSTKENKKQNKWFGTWVERDMVKSGKAEVESLDWVADDLNKVGKSESAVHDAKWVERDMIRAGQEGGEHPTRLKSKPKGKTDMEKVADSMKQAGKTTGNENWVRRDLEKIGRAESEGTRPKSLLNPLTTALDKQREKNYDDVYDDMRKTGKLGSGSNSTIAQDMVNTGRAEHITERVPSGKNMKNYSFKLNLAKSRFDTDWIRKDMEQAGHAESRDWVAGDIKFAGQDRMTAGQPVPAQDKDLSDWITKEATSTVARDIAEQGMSRSTGSLRTQGVSREKLNDLVAQDMTKIGKSSYGSDIIARDMEQAGHVVSGVNRETEHMSHYEREMEEFMKTRKVKTANDKGTMPQQTVKKAPYTGKVTKPQQTVKEASVKGTMQQETDGSPHKPFAIRALKKLVMPWRKWQDL